MVMTEDTLKRVKLGISEKTSLVSSIVVLVLLAIVCIILLNFEANLANSIIDEYIEKVEAAIDKQGNTQKKRLGETSKNNAEITGGIASTFLYNVDSDGLRVALKNYLKFEEIKAIEVVDSGNEPFAAIWKSPEWLSGEVIPKDLKLNKALSASADSLYGMETVGKVTIYYTDTFLTAQLLQVKEQTQSDISKFQETITGRINNAFVVQIFAAIFIVLALVATIIFSLKLIAIKPLNRIIDGLKDIAKGEGDLTRRLDVKRMDEVGELATWFNMFIEDLQKMILDISQTAQNLGKSSDDLSDLSNLMSGTADTMSGKSHTVTASVEEMSSNMVSVASAMEEASTNIGIVASSGDELTSTINEIAENTEKARGVTGFAVTQAKEASEQINKLGQAAKEIGDVSETITEISDQTNLLALNATIEAARAGEAGKGFAVVANEIKELAKQTVEATEQIKARISDIQSSTGGTVTAIEQISKVINEVNDVVNTIATAVEEQSVTTREISGNVSQISQGIQEVNENVSQSSTVSGEIAEDVSDVNQASNDMTNSSSQVNMSAGQLQGLADQLKGMVGKFVVQ